MTLDRWIAEARHRAAELECPCRPDLIVALNMIAAELEYLGGCDKAMAIRRM